MTASTRPEPTSDSAVTTAATPLAQPFIDGLSAGLLRYQHCQACGTAQTLARYACQHCGERSALQWRDASGGATVRAVSEISRAPSAAFRPLLPYTLVIVTLVEGPRLMGHGTPGLKVGDSVQAGFFEHEGRWLIRFAPASVDAARQQAKC